MVVSEFELVTAITPDALWAKIEAAYILTGVAPAMAQLEVLFTSITIEACAMVLIQV